MAKKVYVTTTRGKGNKRVKVTKKSTRGTKKRG